MPTAYKPRPCRRCGGPKEAPQHRSERWRRYCNACNDIVCAAYPWNQHLCGAPHELALIRREARKAGVHILAHYEARDASYTEPQPLNPEDEAAQLQREFIAAVRGLQALQSRIDQNATMRVVA